jgi:hypothetical protein
MNETDATNRLSDAMQALQAAKQRLAVIDVAELKALSTREAHENWHTERAHAVADMDRNEKRIVQIREQMDRDRDALKPLGRRRRSNSQRTKHSLSDPVKNSLR